MNFFQESKFFLQGLVVCVFKDMDQCVGDVEFQLKGIGKMSVKDPSGL